MSRCSCWSCCGSRAWCGWWRRRRALRSSLEERDGLARQLHHQAFHDGLTGLANRSLFTERVRHALARARRHRETVAVLFVDLDDFKLINDNLGHAAGDEFAVLLERATRDRVPVVAERVIRSLDAPFTLAGRQISVRASVGVAIDEGCGHDTAELLRNADVAMYAAKARGQGSYDVFQPGMLSRMLDRHELRMELEAAIEQRQLQVHYQPIVELPSGRVGAVEALVRWQRPGHGLVPPARFIGVAEETGLIVGIDDLVLREACRQGRAWVQGAAPAAFKLHVNMSARSLQRDDLIEQVGGVLAGSGLPPGCLVLEVTESTLLQDADGTIARLHELKRLGVGLAIDDFGTGYSSLAYLRRMPIDALKIDKSFIDGVAGDNDESALARAIISLAGTLRIEAVAEGVERAEQVERLSSLGCRWGQGFHLARPMPPAEVEERLGLGRQRAAAR